MSCFFWQKKSWRIEMTLVGKPGVSPTEETAEGGGVTLTGLPPNEEEIYKTLEEVTILSNNFYCLWHCNCRGLKCRVSANWAFLLCNIEGFQITQPSNWDLSHNFFGSDFKIRTGLNLWLVSWHKVLSLTPSNFIRMTKMLVFFEGGLKFLFRLPDSKTQVSAN